MGLLQALNSVDEGLPGAIPLNRVSSTAEEGDATWDIEEGDPPPSAPPPPPPPSLPLPLLLPHADAATSCDAASRDAALCPPGMTVMTGGARVSAFRAAASRDAELTAELGRPTVTIGMGDAAELCCIP